MCTCSDLTWLIQRSIVGAAPQIHCYAIRAILQQCKTFNGLELIDVHRKKTAIMEEGAQNNWTWWELGPITLPAVTGSIVRDLELGLKELKPGQESLSDCCCRSKHVVSLPLHRQSSLPCYHFSMFYLQTSVAPNPICFVASLSACPTDSKGAKWNVKCKNQVFQALVISGHSLDYFCYC